MNQSIHFVMTLDTVLLLFLFMATFDTSTPPYEKIIQSDRTMFPTIESQSLSGQKVSLPADVKGQITMVTIAFLEEGQPYIDSWAKPYLERYFGKDGFNYYEVPMLNAMPQGAKDYIDSGMRAGIKKELHPNVVTFYGDYSKYRQTLEMKDVKSGYVFLLDRKGMIIYRGEGLMTDDNWKEIMQVIDRE